jgi:preprotein translocase subunit SecD
MAKRMVSKSDEKMIKYHQEQMAASEMSFVEHAYLSGVILKRKKSELDHGSWLEWLKTNWYKSSRTARSYIELASNLELSQVVECQSLKAAQKLLEDKSPKRQCVANLDQESSGNGQVFEENEPQPDDQEPEETQPESPTEDLETYTETVVDGEVYEDVEDEPEQAKIKIESPKAKDWKHKRDVAKKTAEALLRAIDDLAAVRKSGNPRRYEDCIEKTKTVLVELGEWK